MTALVRPSASKHTPPVAGLSLRLILRRMWQRPFVLEDLSKIAAINPPIAGRTVDEMLGLILWGPAKSPAKTRPPGNACRHGRTPNERLEDSSL